MGVTPSPAVVEAAAAATRALSQARLPATAVKADDEDGMASDGAPEATPEAGAAATADETVAQPGDAAMEEEEPAAEEAPAGPSSE